MNEDSNTNSKPKTEEAREWLERHITEYKDSSSRQQFFQDCMEALDVTKKTVQKAYKDTFNPSFNTKDRDIIEDNRDLCDLEADEEEKAIELIRTKVENARLTQKLQQSEDKRKEIEAQRRILLRNSYTTEDYTKELVAVLSHIKNRCVPIFSPLAPRPDTAAGIVQLSDLHFNEEVCIAGNEYNFDIAGKRLYRFAGKAKSRFKHEGIKDVVVTMTGDLLNSNRRSDEALSNTYNRTKGVCAAIYLLKMFLEDLAQEFNITVTSVTGNESRLDKEWGWTDVVASDNYDYLIYKALSFIHEGLVPRIQYLAGNPIEQLLDIKGKHIYVTHGYKSRGTPEEFAEKIRSRMSAKGVHIDYVLYGHKHVACISDFVGVSASLVGGNSFGEFALNKSARASQNLYVVTEEGVDGTRIDLQYPGETGYVVDKLFDEEHINSISNKPLRMC